MSFLLVEIFADQAEEDAVDPLAVAPVGLAPDALAHEAGALGVADRTLVEAVALELEAVVVEVEDQVPLEQPRRLVSEPAPAEVRVEGEAAERGDAAAA